MILDMLDGTKWDCIPESDVRKRFYFSPVKNYRKVGLGYIKVFGENKYEGK